MKKSYLNLFFIPLLLGSCALSKDLSYEDDIYSEEKLVYVPDANEDLKNFDEYYTDDQTGEELDYFDPSYNKSSNNNSYTSNNYSGNYGYNGYGCNNYGYGNYGYNNYGYGSGCGCYSPYSSSYYSPYNYPYSGWGTGFSYGVGYYGSNWYNNNYYNPYGYSSYYGYGNNWNNPYYGYNGWNNYGYPYSNYGNPYNYGYNYGNGSYTDNTSSYGNGSYFGHHGGGISAGSTGGSTYTDSQNGNYDLVTLVPKSKSMIATNPSPNTNGTHVGDKSVFTSKSATVSNLKANHSQSKTYESHSLSDLPKKSGANHTKQINTYNSNSNYNKTDNNKSDAWSTGSNTRMEKNYQNYNNSKTSTTAPQNSYYSRPENSGRSNQYTQPKNNYQYNSGGNRNVTTPSGGNSSPSHNNGGNRNYSPPSGGRSSGGSHSTGGSHSSGGSHSAGRGGRR